eukprot:3340417-Rhodomonas_salina.2
MLACSRATPGRCPTASLSTARPTSGRCQRCPTSDFGGVPCPAFSSVPRQVRSLFSAQSLALLSVSLRLRLEVRKLEREAGGRG